ncbi:MAG: ImmA/IrrE family metallo-endopeptidase [Clostridiales bacterium]|nr:ImmA/IrrE family metallo-endopeptidase [Clostridiales bacterium]
MKEKYIASKAKMLLRGNKVKIPPIPIENIVESTGVRIKHDYNLHKTYAVKYKNNYIILLSQNSSETHTRVELAKKLGYLHLQHPLTKKNIAVGTGDCMEQEMEIFALELLIPDEFLLNELNDHDLVYLNYLHKLFMVPKPFMEKKITYIRNN